MHVQVPRQRGPENTSSMKRNHQVLLFYYYSQPPKMNTHDREAKEITLH